jgi:hypothetical protein
VLGRDNVAATVSPDPSARIRIGKPLANWLPSPGILADLPPQVAPGSKLQFSAGALILDGISKGCLHEVPERRETPIASRQRREQVEVNRETACGAHIAADEGGYGSAFRFRRRA